MPYRRTIVLAMLASLLLHAAFLGTTWNVDLLGGGYEPPEDEQETEPTTVEFVLVPVPEDAADDGRPRDFTSVPERHAVDEPVPNPDFLASVDSRAADLLEGGEEDASPGAEDEGEFSQVAINRDEAGGAPQPTAVLPTLRPGPQPADDSGEGEADEAESASRGAEEGDDDGIASRGADDGENTGERELDSSSAPAEDVVELVPLTPPSSLLRDGRGEPGDPGFTYDQVATGAGGNMVQFGEFRLNTVAWDFAPWLEEFKRDFLPNWIPPYAYALGVIDGKTMLRLEIEPDGRLRGLDVLEEIGHYSLHDASESAVVATAPFAVLPPDFPEETLILELGLHYPAQQLDERPRRVRR